MTNTELLTLKKLIENEKSKRKRINELLQSKDVLEFLKLKGIKCDNSSENSILEDILKQFVITKTNDIYVYIKAYLTDSNMCYQETTYYEKLVKLDNPNIEYKLYKNIENGIIRKAYVKKEFFGYPKVLTTDFEKENIVLNPYNSIDNDNGYDEVRNVFFTESLINGQAKAKKLILNKYKRI